MAAFAQDIAVVTGAPVDFEFKGKTVTLKPLDWEAIGKLMGKLIQRRLAELPTAADIRELALIAIQAGDVTTAKAVVEQIMDMFVNAKRTASNPTYDDLLGWLKEDTAGVVEALSVCSDLTPNEIYWMVRDFYDHPDGTTGIGLKRWMQASGMLSEDARVGEDDSGEAAIAEKK